MSLKDPPAWWLLYHKAMTELPWASPSAFGALTLPQLLCLTAEKPPRPGVGGPMTFEEHEARRAEGLRRDAEWAG